MATDISNFTESATQNMPEKEKISYKRFGIVTAEWNSEITFELERGVKEELVKYGADQDYIDIIRVPGTIELTYGAKYLMEKRNTLDKRIYDAIIVIGCVIQGDTRHFDFVCNSVTQGVTELNLIADGCPVIFCVLTTNNLQQAADRAGGKLGNKGKEAAITAIKMSEFSW